jgi:N-acetylmuramoyl-L-alanine amidase
VQLLARSHRDAGFVVLLAPDVPAVLLEMGFITNLEDEAILAERESRQDFMDSVGDSIDAYFDEELRVASR